MSTKRAGLAALLATTACVGLGCGSPAQAQSAADPQPNSSNTPRPGGAVGTPQTPPKSITESPVAQLQEIVVVAQRRQENLQKVPIAITALSATSLQASGIQTTSDLATVTPALDIGVQSGYFLPHIRGVGTTAFGAGLEGSVSTYIDGVYLASPTASLLRLNNISQIEILKGPQGTLFGRNATGGLIQVITKDPTDDFHGDASIEYGNYNIVTATGYVAGRLLNHIDADLAIYASHQGDGFGTNLYNGRDVYKADRDFALRSKFLLELNDTTKVHLSFDYENAEGNTDGSVGQAPGSKPFFGPAFMNSNVYDINVDFQPYNRFQGGGVSGRLDHDFGSAELVDIIAYRQSVHDLGFDADTTPTPAETINAIDDKEEQFSQELQLQSAPSSSIKWIVGTYYLYSKGQYNPSEVSGLVIKPLNAVRSVAFQETNAAAGFAQTTLPLPVLLDTNLTLGVRYSYEGRHVVGDELGLLGPVTIPILSTDASKAFYRTTWRIALDHAFTPRVLGYASYNRGFKSGGFNAGVLSDAAFAPETLETYEAGLKTEFFGRRLRLNPAIYYYNYKNIQVSHFVLGQIGYYNGAAAELYGIDLDFDAAITSNLTLSGGFAVQQNRFTSFPNALIFPLIPIGLPPAQESASGNELPFAPKQQVNIAVNYRQPLPTGRLDYNVSYEWTSNRFTDPGNILRLPAYNVLNASISWTPPGDRYALRVWARNLTDEDEPVSEAASSVADNVQFAPPRTYGFTLSAKF